MKALSAILVVAFLAGSQARMVLEDGKEYTYQTYLQASAGTMDYATASSGFGYKSKTKIQVNGRTLNIKFYDMSTTQFVGMHDSGSHPLGNTKYTSISKPGSSISITTGSDGLFESLTIDSGASVFERNIARAWAAQLQINTKEIKEGKKFFKSNEKLLQGTCDVSYTVTGNTLYKTVSHNKDCKKRTGRVVDNIGGYRCDEFEVGVNYPNSLGESYFVYEKEGGVATIKRLGWSSSYIVQPFEEEGAAQFVYTNVTSDLLSVDDSAGDISVSGETITDLDYEYSDDKFKWNVDRDLKAAEPLFNVGRFYKGDLAQLKAAVKKGIAGQKAIIENLGPNKEALQKAHKYGINSILPVFYALDYDNLKSLADELFADKSEKGVMMSNVFGELLASAGTTASALVIKDLILEDKFDNSRDAARVLTGIPYHIRRSNKQLVKEFEKMIDVEKEGALKMAFPLMFGHLVRVTCERAGPAFGEDQISCFKEFASQYVDKAWERYESASSRAEKSMVLSVMTNMRYGGIVDKLKPLIQGKVDKEDSQLRTQALWAASWEMFVREKAIDIALPLFADNTECHEVRISALEIIFYTQPSAATLATVAGVMRSERDYEVVNYAFALMERYANSISPCDVKVKNIAKYFLKYMKQYSGYNTDFGFGVSKTFQRQFQKDKYGYGGALETYVIGSHKSTTPIAIGIGLSSTLMNSYKVNTIHAHIRLEGVAKALIRKFKTMDPNTWKTADLENILSGDMQIRERPDQPIRVHIMLAFKGTIVVNRVYDETDVAKEGKIGKFLDKLKGLGDSYEINHQRAAQVASILIEQPTNIGLPMASLSSITTLLSFKANIKRGKHRGLLYRDVKYDFNALTQGVRATFIINPWKKGAYGILNDRLYYLHVPRKFVAGVNPIQKEIKLSIARPDEEHPLKFFMHSQTSVLVRGNNLHGEFEGLKENCPSCETRVIISKGDEYVKDRVFVERDNKKIGYYAKGQYFGCEMDVKRGNTFGNVFKAFMPYNKNPRNLYTSITMGIRQIRAFLFYFPKTEQCGAMLVYHQSKVAPVKEVEISVKVDAKPNGNKLFFSGKKYFVKALIKAKGAPKDRVYKVTLAYQYTPGNLKNSLKLQVNRAEISELDMKPFSLCFAYESEYPPFHKEFLTYDENTDLTVKGKARLQYGKVSSCSNAEGEIRVKFAHSTTQEARDELKNTWYYKECMAMKNTPEWSGRSGLPFTEACYDTVHDATNARKYTWNVEFTKLTDRVKRILGKVRSAVQAGLMPYWDIDPEEIGAEDGEIGPFANVELVFKNQEKSADISVESRLGKDEYTDVPLKLNWAKRLRNLKLSSRIHRLFEARILNPCVLTTGTVRTNDNVTYSYPSSSCWTLSSATCGPNPTYALFTKKTGSGLASKLYVGGHTFEFDNGAVKINGASKSVADQSEISHTVDGVEIFKVFRWGTSYNVYSSFRVWMVTDGTFAEIVPAPSAKGQHCGICGNYNRNKFDEFTGKNEEQLTSAADLVKNWQWKC